MYTRIYKAIDSAHDRLQDKVPWSFGDKFAPDLEEDDTGDIIVALVTLGMLGTATFAHKGRTSS